MEMLIMGYIIVAAMGIEPIWISASTMMEMD
jgi:hypothetical protein